MHRFAPASFAPASFAFVRFAFVRSAFVRAAAYRYAFVRFAPVRFAYLRFSYFWFGTERFAPGTFEQDRFTTARLPFGGCVVVLLRADAREGFRERLQTVYGARFGTRPKVEFFRGSSGPREIMLREGASL